jgi:hypothetical protein
MGQLVAGLRCLPVDPQPRRVLVADGLAVVEQDHAALPQPGHGLAVAPPRFRFVGAVGKKL